MDARQSRRSMPGRCWRPLLWLGLLSLALAGCLQEDNATPSRTPPPSAKAPQTGARASDQAAAPRGPASATQVLQRLKERNSASEGRGTATEPGVPPRGVADGLAAQALDEPNPTQRQRAVQTVALQRNDDATDVLLAAATDPAPGVRRQSLQALWISAKDLPSRVNEIEAALREASNDGDPGIAKLAKFALEDIQRQRERAASR